jgi:hypothetical protein
MRRKLSWVRFPAKNVSVARKLCMIEEQRKENCFGEEIIGTKVTYPKISWVRASVMMGLGIITIIIIITFL